MGEMSDMRELLRGMRRIARAVDLHSRRIDREMGLTLPQLVVLSAVQELGEVTGRAIAEAAGLSPATVVGILDKLETKGLIERYRSRIDRRIVHTRLTSEGQRMLEAAPPPLGREFERTFLGLPARERTAARSTLDRLASLALAEVEEAQEIASIDR